MHHITTFISFNDYTINNINDLVKVIADIIAANEHRFDSPLVTVKLEYRVQYIGIWLNIDQTRLSELIVNEPEDLCFIYNRKTKQLKYQWTIDENLLNEYLEDRITVLNLTKKVGSWEPIAHVISIKFGKQKLSRYINEKLFLCILDDHNGYRTQIKGITSYVFYLFSDDKLCEYCKYIYNKFGGW